ncbi:MAG: hypothetical protein ACI9QC_000565 [Oceanicoccus sp.]|jgi:hypothetical protein
MRYLLLLTLLFLACQTPAVTVGVEQILEEPPSEEPMNTGFFEYRDQEGKLLAVPEQIQNVISSISPGGFDPNWAFSNDLEWILFLDWSDMSIQVFNTQTEESESLMTLNRPDERDWSWNIDFLGWNESNEKTAFVIQSLADDYPEGTKVFILTLEEGKLIQKDKYNLDVLVTCPGNFCESWVDWYDDETLIYNSDPWLYAGDEIYFTAFQDCVEAGACTELYEI